MPEPERAYALPGLLWYGGASSEIRLPGDWHVEVHAMRGGERPPLTADRIAHAIAHPIGTPPLRELAKGRRKAVILFDDLTRPTRADELAPHVVDALLAAGLPEDAITFVCALGAHGALTQNDLRKKLGQAIVERFRVYNHNAYENCVNVGTTTLGTRLWINRHVMSADLKIGLGGVVPHSMAGFSGGGKIVLPGVARMDSIARFHAQVPAMAPRAIGFGRHEANPMRQDADDAARLVGLDFKVDVVFDQRAVATDVFAGDFVASHDAAVALSRKVNALPRTDRSYDVAVVNAVAKPNELVVAFMIGLQALGPRRKGTLVIVANAPEGQVVHYLLGRWGDVYGGFRYPTARVPFEDVRLVIQAAHFDRTFGDWFANPEAITWTRDPAGTLDVLKAAHGAGTHAVVVPEGTIAYYPS